MKDNGIFKKKKKKKLKYENIDYLVTDRKANIIPISNNNILYEMPKE